jgi:hypothetical protein
MTLFEEIEALYEFTLTDKTNQYKRLDIGVIGKNLGILIYNQTNIDVTDYILTLDTYSIIHTLERHGNPIREAKHGQIAIEKQHFIEILDVVLNPDKVTCNTKHNRTALIFEKEKGNKYFVIKEIREVVKTRKKNRLVLQTFYIKKKTP